MRHERTEDQLTYTGEAVIAIIATKIPETGGWYVVVVKQLTRTNPKFKFPGGRVDIKDPTINHALLRETEEETGYTIPHRQTGDRLFLGDADTRVHELYERRIRVGGSFHDQYIYLIVVGDPLEVMHLHGQTRPENDNEIIEVSVVRLEAVLSGGIGFLDKQRPLFEPLINKLTEIERRDDPAAEIEDSGDGYYTWSESRD